MTTPGRARYPPELVGRERVDVGARLERQRPGDELDVIPLHVGDDHDAHLRGGGMRWDGNGTSGNMSQERYHTYQRRTATTNRADSGRKKDTKIVRYDTIRYDAPTSNLGYETVG